MYRVLRIAFSPVRTTGDEVFVPCCVVPGVQASADGTSFVARFRAWRLSPERGPRNLEVVAEAIGTGADSPEARRWPLEDLPFSGGVPARDRRPVFRMGETFFGGAVVLDEPLEPVGRFGGGEGGLLRPRAVAWGPSREIAVADPGRQSVEVFDEFGSRLYALSTPDTLMAEDVLFDDRGSLIVADARHGRLLAFPPGGGAPSASFGGREEWSFSPSALALDRTGRLLVLDGPLGRVLTIEMIHGECPSDS